MTARRADLGGAARRDDGTRLAFQVQGPYGAPALLLLQGQANHHGWWDRLRDAFARTYLTITLDYRGTGATTVPEALLDGPDGWSTPEFADDVAAVLRALGRERAHVYGTSMGGRIAQHLAAAHPDLVDRLVLACTSPGGSLAVERDADVRRALGDPDPAVRLAASFDLFYTPDWVARHGGVEHAPRDLFGDPAMDPRAARWHLRVSGRHDATAVLGSIAAPTLVLHGTDDRMTPAVNAEVLADAIPGARLHLDEDGRHGFFDEHAHDVTPRVLAHLSAGS
ncbi:alpha/beta fold hydrolase [Nocardioides zeae]|uniref:Alpha/beta fold hydrolase n=1 Tax=Nocardioides imazamoxiresistens TaxID=3231893 RepID=A0ABU3PUN2_9ACTN|nr:alpha/beta fold hydrolase [Nocardioides zeae]MDT9592937.1 alpha/beta fold hydrolase [Nocardioides zeae]